MTSVLVEVCHPAAIYSAWLDATDPVNAIRTWDRITLVAHGTSDANGEVNRRSRASAINARKRAIERAPWTDANGRAMHVRLQLESRSYSESHGFMHASYFAYSVHRDLVGK